MRTLRSGCCTLVLWCSFVTAALAQPTGVVLGGVADETGGMLPGVIVDLTTETAELSVVTDAVGGYRFENVQPGPATLTFRLINFSMF